MGVFCQHSIPHWQHSLWWHTSISRWGLTSQTSIKQTLPSTSTETTIARSNSLIYCPQLEIFGGNLSVSGYQFLFLILTLPPSYWGQKSERSGHSDTSSAKGDPHPPTQTKWWRIGGRRVGRGRFHSSKLLNLSLFFHPSKIWCPLSPPGTSLWRGSMQPNLPSHGRGRVPCCRTM